MKVRIENTWKKELEEEFKKPYFKNLANFIRKEYASKTIYPPAKLIFNAFDACPFSQVKVVIIGQDPYHGENQAHGLCFSVNEGERIPPSLQNIYKEIQADLNIPIPTSGKLERWASQGVLLLNSILTVEAHLASSHKNKGWEIFTDEVIQILSEKKENIVFMLWGAYAQQKGSVINKEKHLILKTTHPSPLSAHRGFLGCKHFSIANKYLISKNKSPIKW